MTNKEAVEQAMKVTESIFKITCTIGNYVLIGGIFGACIAFPPIALPLKICAGMTTAALGDLLTHVTDKHIDNCVAYAGREWTAKAKILDEMEAEARNN